MTDAQRAHAYEMLRLAVQSYNDANNNNDGVGVAGVDGYEEVVAALQHVVDAEDAMRG